MVTHKGVSIDGHKVEGVYFKHQITAVCFSNEDTEDNYAHFLVRSGFADWGMERKVELVRIHPESLEEV